MSDPHGSTTGAPEGAGTAAPGSAVAWKIGRRAPRCAECARDFEDGAFVYSSLAFDTTGMGRVDRCGTCRERRDPVPGEIRWRTHHHAKPRKARLDLLGLVDVFRQLTAAEDPRWIDLRYLVALLLLRHRKLRLLRTRSQGRRDFLDLVFGRSKAVVSVEVSDLPKDRIEVLRGQLVALFEGAEPSALAEGVALEEPAEPETKAEPGGTPDAGSDPGAAANEEPTSPEAGAASGD